MINLSLWRAVLYLPVESSDEYRMGYLSVP
jgi:hypothetical protein